MDNNVIQPQQSGFRQVHSTITAGTAVVDDIIDSVGKQHHHSALSVVSADYNILSNKLLSVVCVSSHNCCIEFTLLLLLVSD